MLSTEYCELEKLGQLARRDCTELYGVSWIKLSVKIIANSQIYLNDPALPNPHHSHII